MNMQLVIRIKKKNNHKQTSLDTKVSLNSQTQNRITLGIIFFILGFDFS